jgi:hypothetical protein
MDSLYMKIFINGVFLKKDSQFIMYVAFDSEYFSYIYTCKFKNKT